MFSLFTFFQFYFECSWILCFVFNFWGKHVEVFNIILAIFLSFRRSFAKEEFCVCLLLQFVFFLCSSLLLKSSIVNFVREKGC
jgi:hypothetical protein